MKYKCEQCGKGRSCILKVVGENLSPTKCPYDITGSAHPKWTLKQHKKEDSNG
jgi:hypothetical protein